MTNTYIPARPTTYDGIKMRSRLEARVAAYLDKCGFDWEYEPRAFASSSGQYLPDFRLAFSAGDVYLEAKGARPGPDEQMDILERMGIIWASQPDAYLALCYAEGLSQGYFGVCPPGGDGWWPALMLRCPDHDDRCGLIAVTPSDEGYIASPWCISCDPERDGSVPLRDCLEYVVCGEGY